MSNSPDSTLLLIGLTDAGKTNFLVALDVVLDDQSDKDGLRHSELASERTYLQPLKEQWLRGEVLEHTSRQHPPLPHQLIVWHPASNTKAGLYLPDIAGESFDSHFVTRSIPHDFRDRIENATGLLLFIHCRHNGNHDILVDPELMEPSPTAEAPSPASANVIRDWELEDASPQTKLVDLLQFIMEIGSRQSPLKIAVIISAWDLVEKASKLGISAAAEIPNDPTCFLTRQWPLLDQFLHSQSSIFHFRVFGVSARGGGDTLDEIERITNLNRPSDRILVVDGAHRSNDLTRPVRWLLGLLKDNPSPDG